jgi:hypothetical protein
MCVCVCATSRWRSSPCPFTHRVWTSPSQVETLVDKAFFVPSVTTDDVSLFSVLHGDWNGTMPVKCTSNYTGEEMWARYQRCGKDRWGGPTFTETESVFVTGGTGNKMPTEDEFEVLVIVCHKRTKECYKFFPIRHDLSVCVWWWKTYSIQSTSRVPCQYLSRDMFSGVPSTQIVDSNIQESKSLYRHVQWGKIQGGKTKS